MSAKFIGAHMRTSKGLGNALRDGAKIGCTAVQVFTSSPQTWHTPPITQDKVLDFKKAQQETGITQVITHDSYLINLSAPDAAMREKSIKALTNELARSSQYGIGYVVSHIGAHVGMGMGHALLAASEGIREVLDNSPDDVMLLMETTAGQGSSLNSRFEEMAALLGELKGHKRLGVCLDTCHIFVSGYDIRTAEGFTKTFAEFDRLVGFGNLKAVHCNDSKKGLGSKIDRHEHIGKGEIGIKAFELLVNDKRFDNIPIVVETPESQTMHVENVKVLQDLRK